MAIYHSNSLRRLDLLLNNRSWAFNIHPQYTIALLTAQRRDTNRSKAVSKLPAHPRNLRPIRESLRVVEVYQHTDVTSLGECLV